MSNPQLENSIFGEVEETRRSRRARMRRRGRGPRKWVVILVTVALVVGAGALAWKYVTPIVSSVSGIDFGGGGTIDYPGPGGGSVNVVVKAGDTGEDIATTLKSLGVVKTRQAYIEAAAGDPASAGQIQAGSYVLKKEMTGVAAFKMLIDPANRVGGGITVREGLWASEIYALLSKETGAPVSDYTKAVRKPSSIGLPAYAKGHVEGYLFPATYQFPQGMSAEQQLRTMVTKTVQTLDDLGVPTRQRERVLTLASLVEAEAKLDVDRPRIARVFLNRIANTGAPTYGLLQSDASISYGAKRRALFPSDAELNDRGNPYNLRFHPGLPPGPISNPGAAAMRAAAKPAKGGWLFFVAVNPVTGETRYAKTLAEHNKNVAILNAYCAKKPKDCGR